MSESLHVSQPRTAGSSFSEEPSGGPHSAYNLTLGSGSSRSSTPIARRSRTPFTLRSPNIPKHRDSPHIGKKKNPPLTPAQEHSMDLSTTTMEQHPQSAETSSISPHRQALDFGGSAPHLADRTVDDQLDLGLGPELNLELALGPVEEQGAAERENDSSRSNHHLSSREEEQQQLTGATLHGTPKPSAYRASRSMKYAQRELEQRQCSSQATSKQPAAISELVVDRPTDARVQVSARSALVSSVPISPTVRTRFREQAKTISTLQNALINSTEDAKAYRQEYEKIMEDGKALYLTYQAKCARVKEVSTRCEQVEEERDQLREQVSQYASMVEAERQKSEEWKRKFKTQATRFKSNFEAYKTLKQKMSSSSPPECSDHLLPESHCTVHEHSHLTDRIRELETTLEQERERFAMKEKTYEEQIEGLVGRMMTQERDQKKVIDQTKAQLQSSQSIVDTLQGDLEAKDEELNEALEQIEELQHENESLKRKQDQLSEEYVQRQHAHDVAVQEQLNEQSYRTLYEETVKEKRAAEARFSNMHEMVAQLAEATKVQLDFDRCFEENVHLLEQKTAQLNARFQELGHVEILRRDHDEAVARAKQFQEEIHSAACIVRQSRQLLNSLQCLLREQNHLQQTSEHEHSGEVSQGSQLVLESRSLIQQLQVVVEEVTHLKTSHTDQYVQLMMSRMFGQVIRSNLEAEVAELRPRVQELMRCEQMHDDLVAELEEVRTQLKESCEQVAAHEEQLNELQIKLARCQAELTTHTVIKDQLENTIQASRAEHEHTTAELTRHQSVLHEERRAHQLLVAKLHTAQAREQDLQEELNEWEAKLELQARLLRETTQRKDDLVRMLDERKVELRARNSTQNQMEHQLQDQQTICSRLQKQLNEYEQAQQSLETELEVVQQSKQELEQVQQELRKQLFALQQENTTLKESSGKFLSALKTTNSDWSKKNDECQQLQRELDLLRSAQGRSPALTSSVLVDSIAATKVPQEGTTSDDTFQSESTLSDQVYGSSPRPPTSDTNRESASISVPHHDDVVIIQLSEQLDRAQQAVRKSALKMQLLMQEKEQVILQMEILLLSLQQGSDQGQLAEVMSEKFRLEREIGAISMKYEASCLDLGRLRDENVQLRQYLSK